MRLALAAGNGAQNEEIAGIQERATTLSTAERKVLAGLTTGRLNTQIALELGISPRTVEIYRANILTKMQAKSLSHLVRMTIMAELPRPSQKAEE